MRTFPKLLAAVLTCALALTLLTACQGANGTVTVPTVPGAPSGTPAEVPLGAEDQILLQINQLRTAAGTGEVRRNEELDALAESLMDAGVTVCDTGDLAGWEQAVSDQLSTRTVVVNGKLMSRSTMTFYPGFSGDSDYGFTTEYKIAADATTDVGVAVRNLGGRTYFVVTAARG